MGTDDTSSLGTPMPPAVGGDVHFAMPSVSDVQRHPERAPAPLSDDAAAFIRAHGLTDADLPDFAGLQTGEEDAAAIEAPGAEVEAADGEGAEALEVEVTHEYQNLPAAIADDATAQVLLNRAAELGVPESAMRVLAEDWVREQQQMQQAWSRYDEQSKPSCEEELAERLGPSWERQIEPISYLPTTMAPAKFHELNFARLPSGRIAGNDADWIQICVDAARWRMRDR
jgi:hypothetical protein